MNQTAIKPQIGVSACLMGKPVRFDGGHKRNRFILEQCTGHFDLQPVCPEAELGLGIPRPAIQLRRFNDEVSLVYSKDPDTNLTPAMRDYAHARVQGLTQLDGFILKKDSPSCGMQRVPVYDNKTAQRSRNGTGIFAEVYKRLNPDVPTEDEGRLNDIKIRENFLERVYAHFRWRQIPDADNNLQGFLDFHRNYKLVLMAKNTVEARKLGQLVATTSRRNLAGNRNEYFTKFMQLMARIPSHGQHVNVLMHSLGYLKNRLDTKEKHELLEWFEIYRKQQVSRVTPLALLRHHFLRHPDEYMAEQYYFCPFPPELMQPA